MEDAPGIPRVQQALQQGSGSASTRANAAARPSGEEENIEAGAADPAGTGKRKKGRRGGRRRRRKKAKLATTQAGTGQGEPPASRPMPPAKSPEPSQKKQGAKKPSRPVDVKRPSRPLYLDSRLAAGDRLPAPQRGLFAAQERQAFRKSGVLVSHFEYSLYQVVDRHNAGSLFQIFPRPPKWWPGDWGEIPVPLPMEVCLLRANLVAADGEHPLWASLFQLFLEQLAKGWDLHVQETDDHTKLATLPEDLARKLVTRGAFAFAVGPPLLPSFQLLLDRVAWLGDVPDQRIAQLEAWESVGPRYAPERLAFVGATPLQCECSKQLERAVTRLELVSKVLRASRRADIRSLTTEVEQLAAVTAAALGCAADFDSALAEIYEDLRPADEEAVEHTLERVRRSIQFYRPLELDLPDRIQSYRNRLR